MNDNEERGRVADTALEQLKKAVEHAIVHMCDPGTGLSADDPQAVRECLDLLILRTEQLHSMNEEATVQEMIIEGLKQQLMKPEADE